MKKILLFLLLLTSAICYPTSVYATGYGISLGPPLLRVNIKPGKAISQVFTITNLNNEDKLLVARVVPFSESDEDGNPRIDLKTSPTWLNYFSLANATIRLGAPFTVKAKSSEQLILTLSVPQTAILRDLYATLLVSTYSNQVGITYLGSQVSATIGANMLITVHPDINPPTLLKINPLTPLNGSFIKFGNFYLADNITPISFSSSVKNNGDFTSETKGIFRITDRKESPVYLEGILPVYVIANTQRTLLNTEGKNFSYNPNLARMGFYKATLQIKTENSSAENSIDILFFPFKITLGIFFATFFLIIILRTTRPNTQLTRS